MGQAKRSTGAPVSNRAGRRTAPSLSTVPGPVRGRSTRTKPAGDAAVRPVKGVDRPPLPVGLLLSSALRSWWGTLADSLREAGYGDLSPSMGIVFENIGRDGARISELAEKAAVSKQAVAQVVEFLHGAGYIDKVPDPHDGRAKIMILSERGKDAARATKRAMVALEQRWTEQIGEQHHDALRAALEALLRAQSTG